MQPMKAAHRSLSDRPRDVARLMAMLRPLAAWAAVMTLIAGAAAAQPRRPNIVFILSDDLGYGDLHCYGRGDINTPAIDRLAAEGVRLTNCYANAPDCSPTRTGFLTGRYQQRVGGLECAIGVGNVGRYDDAIRLAEKHELGLPVQETSIARMLKDAGYATGMAGKWHLGYELKFSPNRHGFDHAFYILGGSADYFHHCEGNGENVLRLNEQPIRRDGYITDLITDEAVGFIRREAGKPFFLYVPYTAPHSPYQGPQDWTPQPLPESSELHNQNKGPLKTYIAMIESMDQGVARILKSLEEKGIADNTLVIFTSDNGATQSGSNDSLSGFKGATFEGGIREPGIVRWPGVLEPGTVSDQACITMDFSASIVRVAGAKPPAGRSFDGIDILRLLETKAPPQDRNLFWRSRRGERTRWGVRCGSLKYIREFDGKQSKEFFFDLARDPGETTNLLESRTADVERLKTLLADWEREVRPVR
jgi:arylsulfatase A-like enzyme